MQHILALSVIILHHAHWYSCRAVAGPPARPLLLPAGDPMESYRFKDREIQDIFKQFLERSSSETADANTEKLRKKISAVTSDSYLEKNLTDVKRQREGRPRWKNKRKKSIAPLAIIVTSLPGLTELQLRDEVNKKIKAIESKEDGTPPTNSLKQHVSKYSKLTSKEIIDNEDTKLNRKIDHVRKDDEDTKPQNDDTLHTSTRNPHKHVASDEMDNLSTNFIDKEADHINAIDSLTVEQPVQRLESKESTVENGKLQVSVETSKEIILPTDSWQHSTELIEKTQIEPEKNNKKSVIQIALPKQETVPFKDKQQLDKQVSAHDDDDLINHLFEFDVGPNNLKVTNDNEKEIMTQAVNDVYIQPLTAEPDIMLRVRKNSALDTAVVSTKEERSKELAKCKHKHHDNSRNTYNLSFLFNS